MLLGRSVFAILFFGLLGGFIWSFLAYREAKEEISYISSPQGRAQVAQLEIDALLAKVGGLILLPEGEEPAIATIQDAEALARDEAFYRDAKNGDKVIVYREKAIIYDPTSNRLVNVGPVYLQQESFDSTLAESDSEGQQDKLPQEEVFDEDTDAAPTIVEGDVGLPAGEAGVLTPEGVGNEAALEASEPPASPDEG